MRPRLRRTSVPRPSAGANAARAAALAVLATLAACRTGAPFVAPSLPGAPLLGPEAAARLQVVVVTGSDPRVSPPWIQKAEQVADAAAAELARAGFRTSRRDRVPWDLRVTVSALLRGGDFGVVADANRRILEGWAVAGGAWGPQELAELGKAVRLRLERSTAVAALAGVAATPPLAAAVAAGGPPAPEPAGATTASPPAPTRRLVVADFRGAAPPPVLALLADQTRGALAEAGRGKGITVLSREGLGAALQDEGRPVAPCGDGRCDLEAARAAGADLVVTGEVSVLGEVRILVLKLVEAGSGALVASTHAQAKDDLALVEAARSAAAGLSP